MKEFESSNVYTGTIIRPGKKLAVMNIINILFQMELWMLNDLPASVRSGAIACSNHGQNQNYFSFFFYFLFKSSHSNK